MLATNVMMSRLHQQEGRAAFGAINERKNVAHIGKRAANTQVNQPRVINTRSAQNAQSRIRPGFENVQPNQQIQSKDIEDVAVPDPIDMAVDVQTIDIDEEVRFNDNFSTEYVEDCVDYCRSKELTEIIAPSYIGTIQTEINQRLRMLAVDWLVIIHHRFHLSDQTLHLSVKIMDKYMSQVHVERSRLQLLAVTSTFIAAKYNQIWAPYTTHLLEFAENQYTPDEVWNMESEILKQFDFRLEFVSPLWYIERMLRSAGYQSVPKMLYFTQYLMELALLEYGMLRYTPSMLAAASLYVAHRVKNGDNGEWTPTMEKYCRYKEADVVDCAHDLIRIWASPACEDCDTTRKKFVSSKYGKVAKVRVPGAFTSLLQQQT